VEKGQQEIIWPHFWDSDYQLGQKITFSNIIILADVLQPRSGVKQSIYALQRHTHTKKTQTKKKRDETHCCHQQKRYIYCISWPFNHNREPLQETIRVSNLEGGFGIRG